jgi:DNA modification methylase
VSKKKVSVRIVPIEELVADAHNANRGTSRGRAAVEQSLKSYGAGRSLVLDRNGRVIAGNKTLEAARKAGFKRVAIVDTAGDTMIAVGRTDLDLKDTKAKQLAIADNRTSELGLEWDPQTLQLLDVDLGQFWNDAEIAHLMDGVEGFSATPELPEARLDSADELAKEWRTANGQLWNIGPHRLFCGDCTQEAAWRAVMGGKAATMAFTDPPWNVAIGGDGNPRHRQRKGLQNDALTPEDFARFIGGFADLLGQHLIGDLYCVLGASEWPTLDLQLRSAGFHWSATIIWVKDIFVLGRSKYHRRYEPLWYGWHANGKSSFCGTRNLDDVWEIKRPRISDEHPTMKPVELVSRAIRNSSTKDSVVVDPFCGSGTTMAAAQAMGRVCYGIEIEPKYVAVTLERLAEMGLKPQRSEQREKQRG